MARINPHVSALPAAEAAKAPLLLNSGEKILLLLAMLGVMAAYTWLVHGFAPLLPEAAMETAEGEKHPGNGAGSGGQTSGTQTGSSQNGGRQGAQTGDGSVSASTGRQNLGSAAATAGQGGAEDTAAPQTGENSATGAQAGDSSEPSAQTENSGKTSSGSKDDGEKRQRLARFSKNPGLLSNSSLVMQDLSGLSISRATVEQLTTRHSNLQNVSASKLTFRKCRFYGTDFSSSDLREVMFEDCLFEDVNFDESLLFNVAFVNCRMVSRQRDRGFSKTRFALSRLYNVSFENLVQEDMQFFQISGNITFAKTDLGGLRLEADGSNKFFADKNAGNDLHITLEECRGNGFNMNIRKLESSMHILRSKFLQAALRGFGKMQADYSEFGDNTALEGTEWLVVKNSTVCADFITQGAMYLIDNNYNRERAPSAVNAFLQAPDSMYRTSILRPKLGALCVVEGGQGTDAGGAWLASNGGRLYIYGLKIEMGFFDLDNSGESSELNFENVEIDRGHIYNSDLEKAYWENVKIGHTMTARGARSQKLREIQAVNVELPTGTNFIEPEVYTLVESKKRPRLVYKLPKLD